MEFELWASVGDVGMRVHHVDEIVACREHVAPVSYQHPFLFLKPVELPPGSLIRGVPSEAESILIPAKSNSALAETPRDYFFSAG